jgi:hypothetical protein
MQSMKTVDTPVTERELRDLVRARLFEEVERAETQVFEELSIERGAARVDLAVIGSMLDAYEIKSDFDNFGRLHNQIHAYNRVFDTITIVTGPHFSKAVMQFMPTWWGVSVARRDIDGSLNLDVVRPAVQNEAQSARSMAMFLWRDEVAEIHRSETGALPPRRTTRNQLHDWLAASFPLDALRKMVTQRLLERSSAITTPQSKPDGDLLHPSSNCSDFRCLA